MLLLGISHGYDEIASFAEDRTVRLLLGGTLSPLEKDACTLNLGFEASFQSRGSKVGHVMVLSKFASTLVLFLSSKVRQPSPATAKGPTQQIRWPVTTRHHTKGDQDLKEAS